VDAAGRNVAAFLEVLQDAMKRLGVIWGLYQLRGSKPGRPFMRLSARPHTVHQAGASKEYSGGLVLGFPLEGADDAGYQLVVDLLWDDAGFTIMTEAWKVASDAPTLLREYPPRVAADLQTCADELKRAVEDLKTFDDLIPGNPGA
jgi:hypothetical protein